MFYSVQETVTKMTSSIGQAIASCVVCFYKLCCLLFYCCKINWGDSSIETLIQKYCFQFHLVRKKLWLNVQSFTKFLVGVGLVKMNN